MCLLYDPFEEQFYEILTVVHMSSVLRAMCWIPPPPLYSRYSWTWLCCGPSSDSIIGIFIFSSDDVMNVILIADLSVWILSTLQNLWKWSICSYLKYFTDCFYSQYSCTSIFLKTCLLNIVISNDSRSNSCTLITYPSEMVDWDDKPYKVVCPWSTHHYQ